MELFFIIAAVIAASGLVVFVPSYAKSVKAIKSDDFYAYRKASLAMAGSRAMMAIGAAAACIGAAILLAR